MSETVYLKLKESARVRERRVLLGDLAELGCRDQETARRCRLLEVMDIPEGSRESYVISVVSLIGKIEKKWGQVQVESIGETDCVVSFCPLKKPRPLWEGAKAAFVCLVSFFGSAFAICGVLNTSSGVASGVDSDALTLLTNSRGFLSLEDTEEAAWTITEFLSTTSDALAVTADGTQTSGTYLLGAVSEGDDGGRMTVIGSTSFLNGTLLSQNPSLANQTLFVNALTAGFDDVSNLSIPSKSLAVTYNTIQNPGLWSTAYIIVLPIGILLCGFLFWLKRRKL